MSNSANQRAFWSLIASRLSYAVNWYNIASIFAVMAGSFGEGVSGLGSLTSSFYIGIGIFQIPGGILAARIGPKRALVIGTGLASVTVLLSALVNQFNELVFLRFATGSAMALVFGPAIILVAKSYKKGSEGVGIGIFNGAFYAGGALGLSGWAVLAIIVGWRPSLLISGVFGLITTLMLLVFVPPDPASVKERVSPRILKDVFFERPLVIMTAGGIGISIGGTLIGSFTVYFLNSVYGVPVATAGTIGSLFLIVQALSSLAGARVYYTSANPRYTLFVLTCVIFASLLGLAIDSVAVAVFSILVGGFASGLAFTVMVAAVWSSSQASQSYHSLTVSWVNCVWLLSSFPPSFLFSYMASVIGYSAAWLSGGVLTVAFGLPLLISTVSGRHDQADTKAAASN
jgi:predicted MFS family arabinose efflux permease